MNICNAGCTDNSLQAVYLPNFNAFQLTCLSGFDWAKIQAQLWLEPASLCLRKGGLQDLALNTKQSWNTFVLTVGFSIQPKNPKLYSIIPTALLPYSCINEHSVFKSYNEALRNSGPLHPWLSWCFLAVRQQVRAALQNIRFIHQQVNECIPLLHYRGETSRFHTQTLRFLLWQKPTPTYGFTACPCRLVSAGAQRVFRSQEKVQQSLGQTDRPSCSKETPKSDKNQHI